MAFSLKEFPTISQAIQLAALVPDKPPDTPHVRSVLSHMFELCRNRWVCDFLFEDDRAYLSLFDSPLQRQHALTCSVSITNVESSSANEHSLDSHMNGSFVFVPAFSVEDISVGFGVQEYVMRGADAFCASTSHSGDPSLVTIRYVRDDTKGVLLIVHELPAERAVKVEYMTHVSCTRRNRYFSKFDREGLYAAMRTERGILHPDDILNSLDLLQTVDEYRACPACGLNDGECRGCGLDFAAPTHPLDFRYGMPNMLSHVGAFYGVTNSVVLVKGTKLLTATQGTRIRIVGGVDNDLVNRLSRWAITERLSQGTENPVASVMPMPSGGLFGNRQCIDLPGEHDVEDIVMDASIGEDLEPPERLIDPILDMGDNFLPAMSQPDGAQELLGSSLSSERLSDFLAPISDASNESEECINIAEMGAEPVGIVMLETHRFETAKPATDYVSLVGSPIENNVESNMEKNIEMQEAQDAGAEEVEEETSCVSPESTSATAIASMNSSSLPAVQQVKAKSIRKREGQTGSEGTQEMLDEKERKAELRKQRNREAAQRSNARRKERNDKLRDALKSSHARAAELRAKETVLREENLKLRRLMSSGV